jgi:PAS domain S-box-containing protein
MLDQSHFSRFSLAPGEPTEKLRHRIQELRKELGVIELALLSQEGVRTQENYVANDIAPTSAIPVLTDRIPDSFLPYLQATIEHNPHQVVIIDQAYVCMAINPQARSESRQMFGFPLEPGMSILSEKYSLNPEQTGTLQGWQAALKGTASSTETSISGLQTNPKYYRLHFYPIRNVRGAVIAAVQVGHDITAEKEAQERQNHLQEAVQLSNNKLRSIIKGARYIIAAVSVDMELIELNDTAARFFSNLCNTSIRVGDRLSDLLQDTSFRSLLQRAVRGEEFTRLYKHTAGGSGTQYYELSFSSFRDDQGKLIGTSLIARDISKEQQIEQELKDVKEFRFLAENISQLIWITRPNGEPEYYNERFYRYSGINLEELKLDQWRRLIHPDDLEEGIHIWNRALDTGIACEMEYRLKRASDQTYRWHLVRSIPMKNEKGEITHWIGSATDIHERKLQTEQIAEKNRQLSRINKYLDDFVHSVAHDMRVPVARLQLLIDTFRELPSEEREGLLPKISRSVQHMDATLRGLIQVIELQDRQEKAEYGISLQKVIHDVMERQQAAIQESNAQIRVHNENDCQVTYVRSYLYTIISNLISNALKYRDQQRPLVLDISIVQEKDYCRLVFEDNGIGINLPQYRKHLFQPFRKVNKHIEGLGLGLYVIHTMLEKNGGYVEVDSRPGKGSVFSIYLKEYIA